MIFECDKLSWRKIYILNVSLLDWMNLLIFDKLYKKKLIKKQIEEKIRKISIKINYMHQGPDLAVF